MANPTLDIARFSSLQNTSTPSETEIKQAVFGHYKTQAVPFRMTLGQQIKSIFRASGNSLFWGSAIAAALWGIGKVTPLNPGFKTFLVGYGIVGAVFYVAEKSDYEAKHNKAQEPLSIAQKKHTELTDLIKAIKEIDSKCPWIALSKMPRNIVKTWGCEEFKTRIADLEKQRQDEVNSVKEAIQTIKDILTNPDERRAFLQSTGGEPKDMVIPDFVKPTARERLIQLARQATVHKRKEDEAENTIARFAKDEGEKVILKLKEELKQIQLHITVLQRDAEPVRE